MAARLTDRQLQEKTVISLGTFQLRVRPLMIFASICGCAGSHKRVLGMFHDVQVMENCLTKQCRWNEYRRRKTDGNLPVYLNALEARVIHDQYPFKMQKRWDRLTAFAWSPCLSKQSEDEELDPEVKREIYRSGMSFTRPILVYGLFNRELDGFGRWPVLADLNYAIIDEIDSVLQIKRLFDYFWFSGSVQPLRDYWYPGSKPSKKGKYLMKKETSLVDWKELMQKLFSHSQPWSPIPWFGPAI